MPKSLRCKIKKLCYNGTLTERERDRILRALEQEPKIGHWIYDGDCIICNKCLKAFGWISMNMASNFCPDCGSYNGGGEADD